MKIALTKFNMDNARLGYSFCSFRPFQALFSVSISVPLQYFWPLYVMLIASDKWRHQSVGSRWLFPETHTHRHVVSSTCSLTMCYVFMGLPWQQRWKDKRETGINPWCADFLPVFLHHSGKQQAFYCHEVMEDLTRQESWDLTHINTACSVVHPASAQSQRQHCVGPPQVTCL